MFSRILFFAFLFALSVSIVYSDMNDVSCGVESSNRTGTEVGIQYAGQKSGILRAIAIFAWYPPAGGIYSDISYCDLSYTPGTLNYYLCQRSYDPLPDSTGRNWLADGWYIDLSDPSQQGRLDNLPLASVLDWYNKNSYGKFKLQIMPMYWDNPITGQKDWFRADSSIFYYFSVSDNQRWYRYGEFVRQVLVHSDSSIDFSQYDVDRDKKVDFIFIVSNAPLYDPNRGAIISDLGYLGPSDEFPVEDTMKVVTWFGANVIPSVDSKGKFPNVWAFAHEYGHDIWGDHSSPYRSNYDDKALGPYAMMNGSPKFNGFPPSAEELVQAGWVNATTPTAKLQIVTSNLYKC